MLLADLEPQFLRVLDLADKHSLYAEAEQLADAHGVLFFCPRCTGARAHYVLCWTPVVPAHHTPGPGRWTLSGTGLADLTLSPSVVVSACGAHFWVRDGAIVDC